MRHAHIGIALAAIVTASAPADTIHFTSNADASPETVSHGSFEGMLTYTSHGGGLATVIMSITNTSSHGGWLTGLAFDAASGTSGWSFDAGSSSAALGAWTEFAGPTNVQPFGQRMHGMSTDGDWEGGGDPSHGIAAGESATWTFNGFGDAGVSALDFLSLNGGNNLVLRFRGFDNGASDKLPATPVVPGVGTLAMTAAVAGCRRRRHR